MSRILFNLNGTKFEMSRLTFTKLTESGQVALPGAEVSDAKREEYFLERHAGCFSSVLDYLHFGILHMPTNVCPNTFKRELEFWRIDARVMSPCCYRLYLAFFEDDRVLRKFGKDTNRGKADRLKNRGIKARLWAVLDDPSSSLAAKVYLGISTTFILVSIFVLAASTHPVFQRSLDAVEWNSVLGQDLYEDVKYRLPHRHPLGPRPPASGGKPEREDPQDPPTGPNSGPVADVNASDGLTSKNESIKLDVSSIYAMADYLLYMEYATIVFFTVEAFARICSAPDKCRFFRNFLNVVELVALAAMYTTVVVEYFVPAEKYKASVLDYVESVQMLRVLRIFRVVKDVTGFRVLVYSLESSVKEILLLALYLSIGTVLFSSLVYFLERENMRSIPDAAWWVVVTMTTVGYGDMVPVSFQGKLVGCLCAISGVVLIAVTVPIFVSNFLLFYTYSKVVHHVNTARTGNEATEQTTDGKMLGDQEKYKMGHFLGGPDSAKRSRVSPREAFVVSTIHR